MVLAADMNDLECSLAMTIKIYKLSFGRLATNSLVFIDRAIIDNTKRRIYFGFECSRAQSFGLLTINNIQIDPLLFEDYIYKIVFDKKRLEYIFVGLLLNNPKAISRFYFLYEDCHFANQELLNIYKSVVFREGEAYIPAAGKEKFTFPNEDGRTYDLKMEVKNIVSKNIIFFIENSFSIFITFYKNF